MYKIALLAIALYLVIGHLFCFGQEPGPLGNPSFFKQSPDVEEPASKPFLGQQERNIMQSPLTLPPPQTRIGPKLLFEGMIKKKEEDVRKPEDPCPASERLARKQAEIDVTTFFKKRPLATWDLFIQKFRQQYSGCPTFVKRAYLRTAKDMFLPKQKDLFAR